MTKPDLDAFSERRLKDLYARYDRLESLRQYAENALWAGMLADAFDDHELHILKQTGVWCANNTWALRNIGRDVPEPNIETEDRTPSLGKAVDDGKGE